MKPKELTLRGLILGALITTVFTAANVYLGLKVGLTFSTAIPAAVISMALLQRFGGVTIQENNIVQTLASSAGAMASVIFVLPGLVMVGWWANFPKYAVSLLRAWYGDTVSPDNEWGYQRIPKIVGDHSQLPMTLAIKDGTIRGLFVLGQNPVVGGHN